MHECVRAVETSFETPEHMYQLTTPETSVARSVSWRTSSMTSSSSSRGPSCSGVGFEAEPLDEMPKQDSTSFCVVMIEQRTRREEVPEDCLRVHVDGLLQSRDERHVTPIGGSERACGGEQAKWPMPRPSEAKGWYQCRSKRMPFELASSTRRACISASAHTSHRTVAVTAGDATASSTRRSSNSWEEARRAVRLGHREALAAKRGVAAAMGRRQQRQRSLEGMLLTWRPTCIQLRIATLVAAGNRSLRHGAVHDGCSECNCMPSTSKCCGGSQLTERLRKKANAERFLATSFSLWDAAAVVARRLGQLAPVNVDVAPVV